VKLELRLKAVEDDAESEREVVAFVAAGRTEGQIEGSWRSQAAGYWALADHSH
jgi:hypothetical protein